MRHNHARVQVSFRTRCKAFVLTQLCGEMQFKSLDLCATVEVTGGLRIPLFLRTFFIPLLRNGEASLCKKSLTADHFNRLRRVQHIFIQTLKYALNINCPPHHYSSVRCFLNLPSLAEHRRRSDNISSLQKLPSRSVAFPSCINTSKNRNQKHPLLLLFHYSLSELSPYATNYFRTQLAE